MTLPEGQPQLVFRILSYFLCNPEAADTLEGVTRWCLLEESIHQSLEEASHALTWLVAEGYLLEIPVSGSDQVFRLNPKRRSDAQDLLRRSKLS